MSTTSTTAGGRRRFGLGAIALVAVLVAAGCGDDTTTATGGSDVTEPPTTTTTSAPDPNDDGFAPGEDGGPTDERARAAVADLAERLGVDPAEVTVVAVEAVTWRDGSLGCPQPGMAYTQALVEGIRIVLEVDGRGFRYHGGASTPPTYCATPEEPYQVG